MSFPERRNQSVEDNMELPSWRRGSSKKVDTDAPDPDVGENFRRGVAPVQEQATPAGIGISQPHPDAQPGVVQEERGQISVAVREPAEEAASRRNSIFPTPPVLGAGPSFAPFLGPLPESVAAMTGHAVSDTVLDGAEFTGLTVRGASIRGDDHRARQEVRQDAMGMWQITDGETSG